MPTQDDPVSDPRVQTLLREGKQAPDAVRITRGEKVLVAIQSAATLDDLKPILTQIVRELYQMDMK